MRRRLLCAVVRFQVLHGFIRRVSLNHHEITRLC